MAIGELGSKIVLEKFDLDEEEMTTAKKLIEKHAEKIGRLVDYQELRLEMRIHKKEKNNHFEIKGQVIYDNGKVVSERQDTNPFVALREVLEKMQTELEHKIRKK
jgi:ribosome-associated translation inhibitor RaiA